MKIAVISDIHGNVEALTQVLRVAKKRKVQHLFVLGDIIGYYYHSKEVLSLLSEWECSIIKGNHEQILQDVYCNEELSLNIKRKYGSAYDISIKQLLENELSFLFNLPPIIEKEIDGINFLLAHSNPFSSEHEYLYPDTNKEILSKCNDKNIDFIFVGHSHYPFITKNKNSILINPGSIGQSRRIGGYAEWGIFTTENNTFEFMFTPYSTNNLLKDIMTYDPNLEYLSKILKRNE